MTVFMLNSDESIDDIVQSRRQMPEILVKSMTNSQRGEYRVVDECRSEISQCSRGVLSGIFVKMSSYQVIEHGVAEELQPLIAVSEAVGGVRSVRHRLQQVGSVAEFVVEFFLESVEAIKQKLQGFLGIWNAPQQRRLRGNPMTVKRLLSNSVNLEWFRASRDSVFLNLHIHHWQHANSKPRHEQQGTTRSAVN